MKYLLLAIILCPIISYGDITTHTFCNQDEYNLYPNPTGWADYAICEDNILSIIVDQGKNKAGKTKYKRVYLRDGQYLKKETGLACNISIYRCNIEESK